MRSGERIQCLALVCILFTAVVWGFALYFFFQGLSTWQVSVTDTHLSNNAGRTCVSLICYFSLLCSENSSWVSWTQQRMHPAFLLWRPWCVALPILHCHVWILPGMLSIQTYNILPVIAWLGSNLSTALLGPPHPGWRSRHRPERQNLCLLDFRFHLYWAKHLLSALSPCSCSFKAQLACFCQAVNSRNRSAPHLHTPEGCKPLS